MYNFMKNYVKFFSLILFSFLILSACSSMLVISTAAFVTTTWYDSRTVGSQLDDSVLKVHIYHALNQNKQIKKYTRIVNTVYQGHVLLTGQSPSVIFTEEAIKIIMKIHGIKSIYNAIRQDRPISLQSILIDMLISNQIRLNLFTQKNRHISNIKVIVENKEVFLLGRVTNKEGLYAKEISNNVYGVKNVFTVFIYI